MSRFVLIVLLLFGFLADAHADPSRRVALVIGNSDYEATGKLANPVNDASDISARLKTLGFEVVDGQNLGKRDLERKIGEFADRLDGAKAGLFFYAGHGLQVGGRNFIVPVDAKLDVQVKLQLEAVPIDEVLDIMEQQTEVSLVFLDACRNNPFVATGKTADRGALSLQGLAQFDGARGSFIAFSTAPGSVAMDGAGRNSPFAAALLAHISEPGQSISDLMLSVRKDVVAATRDKQRPWEQGSLTERFEFAPVGGSAAPAASAQTAIQPPSAEVASAERSVGDTGSIEYLIRHDYLAPDVNALAETVKRLYGDPVTVYGTPMSADALVAAKSAWFGQYASWKLALEPGSLVVTPGAADTASAVFSMTYDYAPKAGGAHAVGRARVLLGLKRRDGGWRILSETSQAL